MPRPRLKAPVTAGGGGPSFVAYYRVSTAKQGASGLGLEAQKAVVGKIVEARGGRLVEEHEEVESGKNDARPALAAALAACRTRRAILVIAKIDRLARNARFLLNVVEGTGEAGVLFADLPQIPEGPTGKFLLTLLAAVAELEAGMISARTKAALAAAKARGVKLGGRNLASGFDSKTSRNGRLSQTRRSISRARELLPLVEAAQRAGCVSQREIADALQARGIRTPQGGEVWHPAQVARILKVSARAEGPSHGLPAAGHGRPNPEAAAR